MDKVALIPAVERLLTAIDDEDVLDEAIQGVKDALGYDPTLKEQDYLVKLEIEVWAKTPKDAVKEFIRLVADQELSNWMYRVIDEKEVESQVPGWE